jgi:hypothetical protein
MVVTARSRQPRWRLLLAEDPGVFWVDLHGHWHPAQKDQDQTLPFFLLTKRVRSGGKSGTVRELRVVLDALEANDSQLAAAALVSDPVVFADRIRPLLQSYAQFAASHPATNDARLRGKVAVRWLEASGMRVAL